MNDYFKYLPIGENDEKWGISILNTGCTSIKPNEVYPSSQHPAHHHFKWSIGRILNEYQVIYITKGSGIFESSRRGRQEVESGTVIFLFPNEKHRYKPDAQNGWDEFWVGFRGKIIDDLVKKRFFDPKNPCVFIGFDETLINLFLEIINRAKEEKPGYQPQASGALLHILGRIYSLSEQLKFEDQYIPELINKSRFLFRSNIEKNTSPADVARELNISYSKFRKIFKEYTGLAPGQFQIQLRISRAKELLGDPNTPIKQIAYDLGFKSDVHFSKLFKSKTGQSPQEFKNCSQKEYINKK